MSEVLRVAESADLHVPAFWADEGPRAATPEEIQAAYTLADLFWQIDEVGHVEGSPEGYCRYGWTDEDAVLRTWFAAQAQARGMELVIDGGGNQWAWLGGLPSEGRPGVALGSHLDSVPHGGAFDGPLGVLSSLVALDVLRARGWQPPCPVGVANYHDEEGARFALACLGSRVATGAVDPARVVEMQDLDGVSCGDAMAEFASRVRAAAAAASGVGEDVAGAVRALGGLSADALATAVGGALPPTSLYAEPALISSLAADVELHVEQGLGQAREGVPVAVAGAIWPHGRWRADIAGEPNHAGTTALEDRHDPMLAFARFVLAVREEAKAHDARATVGKLSVVPNGTNVIASQVTCWVDCRAASERAVQQTMDALAARAEAGEFRTFVGNSAAEEFSLVRESLTPATPFSPELREELCSLVSAAVPEEHCCVLDTGAGHDAGIMQNAGVPTGMLFVRNATGASHTPAEYATWADATCGVMAYASAIEGVCGRVEHNRGAFAAGAREDLHNEGGR